MAVQKVRDVSVHGGQEGGNFGDILWLRQHPAVAMEVSKYQILSGKIAITGLVLLTIVNIYILKRSLQECQIPLWEQYIDFEFANISNVTGTKDGRYIVPNYIHFLRFDIPTFTYVDMICVLAVLKNQKPEKVIFHRNHNKTFTGRYWNVLNEIKAFTNIVEFNYIDKPEEIFGQTIEPIMRKFHGGDITRIRILMEYGGIFLDNDAYVVRSLDNFRKYEMTLNWDENQYLGTQVLLAHKDARFLKLWLESYRSAYRGDLWYYNAGERPTKEILYKRPELVHRVRVLFGVNTDFIGRIFQMKWSGWKRLYSLHLLIHHQYLLTNLSERATFPVEFNEGNIGFYPITFREMAYSVYDFAQLSWPKHKLYEEDHFIHKNSN